MIRFFGLRLAASALTLAVVLQPTGAHARPVATAAPVMQMAHISIEAVGKGSPVVFIPGLSMPRENWRSEAERLKARHRVYLVQINGFGGSAPGDNLKPGMLDGVVADLHAFVAKEKITPAIVGHSLGGTLALMWAKAHPEDVRKALIVDALPWVGLIMAPPTATPAMIAPQAQAMRDAMAAHYGKPADLAAAKATMARLALKPASQEQGAQWSLTADPRVTAEAFYEDLMLDLRPDMANIATPLTLIYPTGEAGSGKTMADGLYQGAYAKAPQVTYVPVADSAHFVMLDQPAAFDAALDAFLAG
ncbi:Alpha/beta hydrolase [Sphingomonas sp. EC-HK361]|uniref:alpha/beta fold hydrolase n=1 Tax=Sphingomonas sp. EC-HK361 TaxID=2038397 RepID=UPI00125869F7|nr:alpha/beta hydrolase [Sphingomonas sp. EC-HK361]VVS96970.1 Alpha/beta hydrolase [Sphingomonas sp. EC-HK361]